LADQDIVEPVHGAGRWGPFSLERLTCPGCQKVFSSRGVMLRHRRDVHGEKTSDGPPPKAEKAQKKVDKAPRSAAAPPIATGGVEAQVMNFHMVGAVLAQMFGFEAGAQACLKQGPIAAQAWAAWAEQSDLVRRTLESGTMVTAAVGVFVAEMPILVAILTELRERRLAQQAPPEAEPVMPTEAYPGTDITGDEFAFTAPSDGQGTAY
jgi:uncharacterized C2H2 Zn-finger protein